MNFAFFLAKPAKDAELVRDPMANDERNEANLLNAPDCLKPTAASRQTAMSESIDDVRSPVVVWSTPCPRQLLFSGFGLQ